jgi:hypothetical protein
LWNATSLFDASRRSAISCSPSSSSPILLFSYPPTGFHALFYVLRPSSPFSTSIGSSHSRHSSSFLFHSTCFGLVPYHAALLISAARCDVRTKSYTHWEIVEIPLSSRPYHTTRFAPRIITSRNPNTCMQLLPSILYLRSTSLIAAPNTSNLL